MFSFSDSRDKIVTIGIKVKCVRYEDRPLRLYYLYIQ